MSYLLMNVVCYCLDYLRLILCRYILVVCNMMATNQKVTSQSTRDCGWLLCGHCTNIMLFLYRDFFNWTHCKLNQGAKLCILMWLISFRNNSFYNVYSSLVMITGNSFILSTVYVMSMY